MKTNHIIIILCLSVGLANGKGNYETTEWLPEGNQKFVDVGTKVITLLDGKTGHSATVELGKINVVVKLSSDARSKDGWILDKKKTLYRLCSTGIPFGQTGIPYIEQKNGDFMFGFDVKEDESNNGKSTTLYGQVIMEGEHQKTKEKHADKGVSGKDSSVTITLKC